jgi:hypothetical protein
MHQRDTPLDRVPRRTDYTLEQNFDLKIRISLMSIRKRFYWMNQRVMWDLLTEKEPEGQITLLHSTTFQLVLRMIGEFAITFKKFRG